MKRSSTLACAVLALGLVASAVPVAATAAPAYQAAGKNGGMGWSTATLPNGNIVVAYTGNSRMKPDQVSNYALLRAAEIAQDAGAESFSVIASSVGEVEPGSASDLAGRNGAFFTDVSAGVGQGADINGRTGNTGTGSDANIPMGPSTGGFGGGDVPTSALEQWRPQKVAQALLVIQIGKADASAPAGDGKPPQIFDTKSTLEGLRPHGK